MNELKHIAVIADGNGRWASMRGKSRSEGHEKGLYKIEDMMHWCVELNIPVLSVYVFSLENWKRPKEEVDNLGKLAEHYFDRYQEFADNNIKVVISGVEDNFEQSTLDKIERIQSTTKHCTGLTLNLCANYSGRREIIDAIANGARTEEEISSMLYQNLPEPDLIIRTGGYQRLSNFFMWQSAYSELYFCDTFWPDFKEEEFHKAICDYQKRERRFGKTSEQI